MEETFAYDDMDRLTAYEPRDLGLLQLSTDDPIVVLMEKKKTPKEAEKENRNKTKKIKTAF